jgi:hypothetical protein
MQSFSKKGGYGGKRLGALYQGGGIWKLTRKKSPISMKWFLGCSFWTGELEPEGFNLELEPGALEFVNGMLIFPTSQLFLPDKRSSTTSCLSFLTNAA